MVGKEEPLAEELRMRKVAQAARAHFECRLTMLEALDKADADVQAWFRRENELRTDLDREIARWRRMGELE